MSIKGLKIKHLETHYDERGFFRELIRVTDDLFVDESFGQWSMSYMVQDTIKAWHIHRKQIDWWYVPIGTIKAAFYDNRLSSPTYRKTTEQLMGEHYPLIIKIPPGVAHGLRVLQGPAYLFYITSRVYDPNDELRILHNDSTIGYDWLKGAIK